MKAEAVTIYARHRADNEDKYLSNKRLYSDDKGLYIIYDKSSWYVKEGNTEGFYVSTEYRKYLG